MMMKSISLVLCLILSVSLSLAQPASLANLDGGLALQGYDPVAYFVTQQPTKGRKEFAYTHQGATYYFDNRGNREKFAGNPSAYEPQYGGWCAYAMGATGEKVEIDPETFKITEGKLYLFYNRFFNNTLPKWNKEEPSLKLKADRNWTALTHSK